MHLKIWTFNLPIKWATVILFYYVYPRSCWGIYQPVYLAQSVTIWQCNFNWPIGWQKPYICMVGRSINNLTIAFFLNYCRPPPFKNISYTAFNFSWNNANEKFLQKLQRLYREIYHINEEILPKANNSCSSTAIISAEMFIL